MIISSVGTSSQEIFVKVIFSVHGKGGISESVLSIDIDLCTAYQVAVKSGNPESLYTQQLQPCT